jgi:hypothetical protein
MSNPIPLEELADALGKSVPDLRALAHRHRLQMSFTTMHGLCVHNRDVLAYKRAVDFERKT